MMNRFLLLAALLLASACGREATSTTPQRPRAPLELVLRTSSGESFDVAEYRGRVILFAMLGTYDTASQASLESLSRFYRHHEDVLVVAILAQQGAEILVDAYAAGASVPFPIAYADDPAFLEGNTALGKIEAVPSFYSIDADGFPARAHPGFASERTLEILVEAARAAAPERPRAQPPLLGTPR